MSEQKPDHNTTNQHPETAPAEGAGDRPSPLSRQILRWEDVARLASAECEQGIESARLYELRKNRTSQ